MTPDTPGIVNKKLLVVALVLAAVVVVAFNFHVARVRREARGDTVRLLRLRSDMQAGERIDEDDLEVVEIDRSVAEGYGDVLTADRIGYATTSTLNQSVRKGRWLQLGHTITREEDSPSARIVRGLVTHTFGVDSQRAPGELLRIGDRVNVLGMLSLGGRPLQAYRIIENLKVVEIGGRSYQEPSASRRRGDSSSEGMRQFQKITVEVPPDVSIQLANVLTHVQGDVWIEVRNPTDRGPTTPQVNPALEALAAAATPPTRTGAAIGP